jgi:hypothetical protein
MCHVVAAILDFQFDPQKIYFKSDIWGTFLWFNNSIEHGFWKDFLKLFQPSKHYWTSSHVDNQPITFLPSLFPFAQLFSEKKTEMWKLNRFKTMTLSCLHLRFMRDKTNSIWFLTFVPNIPWLYPQTLPVFLYGFLYLWYCWLKSRALLSYI